MQLRSDVEFSATSITRVGKGKLDTAFFGHFHVDFVETVTNLANGKFFTVEGHVLNKTSRRSRRAGRSSCSRPSRPASGSR